MSKSFFFRLTIFTTARNGFCLLSGCHESLVLYFFLFQQSKTTFRPTTSQCREILIQIFQFIVSNSNRPIAISRFSVVKSSCNKCSKLFCLPSKICEELSAEQNLEIQQILSLQKSRKVE